MRRLIVGAITLGWLASNSAASQEMDPKLGLILSKSHTVETAIEARTKACIENGGSLDNCVCRAQTAANIMGKKEFLEETVYIELLATSTPPLASDQALQSFRNRLLDEQPNMMMRLGQALSECPSVRMELEKAA